MDTFIKNFEDEKDDYFSRHYDAEYTDYLLFMAVHEVVQFPWIYRFADGDAHNNIELSRNKKRKFIVEKAIEDNYKIEFIWDEERQKDFITHEPLLKDDIYNVGTKRLYDNSLNWSGTDLQLAELLKSLIESKLFVGYNDKEVFEKVFDFFGVQFSDSTKKERLSTIRARTKDLSPFLNKLEINLNNWIRSKDN